MRELELEERDDRHLVLADTVVRSGCGRTGDFADGNQERPGQTGPGHELLEGLAAVRGEDAIRRIVHEVEREGADLQGLGKHFERDPGRLELLDDPDPSDVAFGQSILGIGLQDLELDEAVQRLEADPRALGRLWSGIDLHGPTVASEALRGGRSRVYYPLLLDAPPPHRRPDMSRLFVHIATGPENPTRIALALLVARGALDSGHEVDVFIAGDGVSSSAPRRSSWRTGSGRAASASTWTRWWPAGRASSRRGCRAMRAGSPPKRLGGLPVTMATPKLSWSSWCSRRTARSPTEAGAAPLLRAGHAVQD